MLLAILVIKGKSGAEGKDCEASELEACGEEDSFSLAGEDDVPGSWPAEEDTDSPPAAPPKLERYPVIPFIQPVSIMIPIRIISTPPVLTVYFTTL